MNENSDQPDEDWIIDDGPEGKIEALQRHQKYASLDPFPSVPAALLGSPAFLKYIRTTGMIHPFRGWDRVAKKVDTKVVKPASYEMRPGGSFFYFDDQKKLVERKLDDPKEKYIRLPANSITFVSTQETFRLPLYIAVRFNLRIKHVHRGILLGTGPLIDPGYDRPILIPLHNLTDEDYFIPLEEGLIWVEFTKTHPSPSHPHFRDAELGKPRLPETTHDKDFRDFLFAASNGAPIRSSISGVSQEAARARARVERFERRLWNYGFIGAVSILLAVAALLYPTLSLIFTANQNLDANRKEVADLQRRLSELERQSRADGGKGATSEIEKPLATEGTNAVEGDGL